MIRAIFSGLAGAWVARNVEQGEIPERFAVPLTLLAARIPTPVLLAAVAGYGFYRWNQEIRAYAAQEITPEAPARSARKTRPAARHKRPAPKTSKPTAAGDQADP